jgi:hypothetical protein
MARIAISPPISGTERGAHKGEVNQLMAKAGTTVRAMMRSRSTTSSSDPMT